MDTFLTIVGIHAVLIGFALLFGGFLTLVAPSQQETEAIRREYERERAKSWGKGFVFSLGQAGSARGRVLSQAVSHWSERPQSRRLIYFGLACLGIAAAVGCCFEAITS